MTKRLSDRLSKLFVSGVLVSSLFVTPQANAIGTAEQAQMVNSFMNVSKTNYLLPFKWFYQESLQPKNQFKQPLNFVTVATETPVEVQQDQLQKEQAEMKRLQAEYESKVQEERTTFLRMVKQRDIKYINLKTPSGLTATEVEKILDGTHLAGLGEAFANAEKTHKVNAYYLIAHAAWESAWGESKLAKNKNNLFGFSAYDASAYSSASQFSTKAKCIDVVASFISEHYLTETGDHFNGPNLKGMNKKYASDQKWAQGIADTIESLVQKNQAL